MKQLKTLIIKEWHTHRNTFLLPMYFMIGFYLVTILLLTFGLIRYGMPTNNLDEPLEEIAKIVWMIYYYFNFVIAIFSILSMIGVLDLGINDDQKYKCAIFHGSQPVSIAKVLAGKLLFSVAGGFLLYLIISLVNGLLFSFAFKAFLKGFFYMEYLSAIVSIIPYVLLMIITFLPMTMLSSSLIKKKGAIGPIFWFAAFLELLRLIMDALWKFKLPSLYRYVSNTLTTCFKAALKIYNYDNGTIIAEMSRAVFNLIFLYRFLAAMVMVVLSYHLYKRRNIS